MCIKLEEISSYSKAIVDFIQSHQDAYTGLEHLKENIDVPQNRKLFNILKDNQIVGFFIVANGINKGKDYGCEIEIGVFDDYKGKGIAIQTIKHFLENYINDEFKKDNNCIYAVVNKSNKCLKIMSLVLRNCKFMLDKEPIEHKENEKGMEILKKYNMPMPTNNVIKELIYYYKL